MPSRDAVFLMVLSLIRRSLLLTTSAPNADFASQLREMLPSTEMLSRTMSFGSIPVPVGKIISNRGCDSTLLSLPVYFLIISYCLRKRSYACWSTSACVTLAFVPEMKLFVSL